MQGQTIIIILLGLIVVKLYPTLGYVATAIAVLIALFIIIKYIAISLYKFESIRFIWQWIGIALIFVIPVGIAYFIDIIYPSNTERWILVLCFYAAGIFLLAFHWCFEKVNGYISKPKK